MIRPLATACLVALCWTLTGPPLAAQEVPQRDTAAAGDPALGIDPFSECEASFRAARADWNGCGCFYSLATSGQGLLDEAAARLKRHLDDAPGDACLNFSLGRLRILSGDITGDTGAESLLNRAAGSYRELGQAKGEVYARLNLSRVLYLDGRQDASQRQLEAAREAADAAGEKAGEALRAQVDLHEAKRQLSRGDDAESLERSLVELASRPLVDDPNSTFGRDALQTLGNVRYVLGRYVDAEASYRRMAEVCRARRDLYGEATALQSLVSTRLARGPAATTGDRRRRELVALQREALDASVAAQQAHAEASARTRLGKLLDGDEAERELRRAADLARELGNDDLRARALAALASHLVDRSPDEARRLADESQELARSSPHATSVGYGWADRLEVTWRTSPRAEALEAADETLRWVDTLRHRQDGESGRARLFGVWTEVHYALAGRLLDIDRAGPEGVDPATAFELMERMRARVLRESVLRVSVDGSGPQDAEFATLDNVSKTLGEGEALLSFQMDDWQDVYGNPGSGAWLVVVTRDGHRVHRLPGRSELDAGLRLFGDLFQLRDGSEQRPALRLYEQLLASGLGELPPAVDCLILVPDGRLYGLPFAALADAEGRPLASRYQLTQVPSASLWLRSRLREGRTAGEASPADSREILVFADPKLDTEDTRLASLPHARREGRAAVRRLGAGRVLLGEQADEAAVKTLPPGEVDLLHFAAHAVLDAARPHRSAVMLAAGEGEDGRLQPHEISALDLDGAVVVLSTCHSAGGEALAGEGPLSLARAFLQAGASTVVGSLWPLRDDETARLFDDFYRHLAAGRTVSEALTRAQRDRIEAGEPAAAWAGVVVLGDGNATLPAKSRQRTWWLYALLAGSALALGAWLRLR